MAKIYRDDYGIPHIMATTSFDAAKAIAYVHSEDDFYTLQLWFLAIKFKSGHFDDWDGPYLDFLSFFFDIQGKTLDLLPTISDEYKSLADSYCSGINQYAKEHEENVLDPSIFPVNSVDLLQVQHLMEVIGIQIDKPYSYLNKKQSRRLPHKEGSNAIAIGANKSASKSSLIAISPHQMLEGIFSYYEVNLSIEDSEFIEYNGFILPCSFSIFMGTNFQIAWGSTASYPEMYTIYKIDVQKRFGRVKSFLYDGKEILLKRCTYKNYIKLYGKIPIPIIKNFYESEFGNIIEIKGTFYLILIDMLGKQFGAEMVHKLNVCKSNSEALNLLRQSRYTYLDLVCIDKDNNLLYVHNSHEKVREDESLHYKDVLDVCHLREELSAQYYKDNLVVEKNPACGYIVSANQSPLNVTDTHRPIGKIKGLVYQHENSRSNRIKDILNATELFSIDDLKSILFDYKISLPIIRNVDLSALYQPELNSYKSIAPLLGLLRDWDGNACPQSEAAAIFALFFYKYKEKYYVCSKNPDIIKIATVQEIVDCLSWVKKRYYKGQKLENIQFLRRGEVSLPIGGVPDSINTVRPYFEKGKLYAEEASAFRMIVDLRNRISLTCHPYGASSNMKSPNYTNQMRMFIEGGYKRLKTIDYYQNNYNFYEL